MIRSSPAALALMLIAAAAMFCGCSGLPFSAPASGAGSGAEPSERYGAPTVDQPRDLRGRDQRPCELLSPTQLATLRIAVPGQASLSALDTPRCTWSDRVSDQRVALAAYGNHDLFVDTYHAHLLPVSRPGMIEGLPVLYEQTDPQSSNCDVTVGVATGQAFNVSFDRLEDSTADPCDGARRVAEAVITNLPHQQ